MFAEKKIVLVPLLTIANKNVSKDKGGDFGLEAERQEIFPSYLTPGSLPSSWQIVSECVKTKKSL